MSEITTDDIKALERRAALFPAMRPERAEFYALQLDFQSVHKFSDGAHSALSLWEQMDARQRAFLCRVAGVAPELARAEWLHLTDEQRELLVARFMWLREFVLSFHPPLVPYLETALVRNGFINGGTNGNEKKEQGRQQQAA